MARLTKREQREQAEREEAALLLLQVPDEEDEDDDDAPLAPAVGGFQALDEGIAEDEDEDEQVIDVNLPKRKSKPKKKKAKVVSPDPSSIDSPSPSTPAPSSAKKASSKSAKVVIPPQVPDDGLDDIDRALAEIAAANRSKNPSGTSTPSSAVLLVAPGKIDPKWVKLKETFAFDAKFLDADKELKRLFGSKIIASSAPIRSNHHARFANNPHHVTSIKRTSTYLAIPEAGWIPLAAARNGITLARSNDPESRAQDGSEWWTYVHSQEYKEGQMGFLEVLQQADGNRLWDLLESHPYQVDCLMQLSEMQVQQGDLGASSTALSKALYALSAPLPASFTSGNFRLSYSKIENRAFFLGISRKVNILLKRGTWRTACEWAKIALGAGGDSDPVGMLVMIDFLAPKAKQDEWFLGMLESLPAAYPHMRLANYPGLAFAKALCLRNIEGGENAADNEKSTAALRTAILTFPMVVTLLYSALGGNLPPALQKHRRAQVDGAFSGTPTYLLSLMSSLYVHRSSPLWKEPPVFAWLKKTVESTAASLDDSSLPAVVFGEHLFIEGSWPRGLAPSGVIRAVFIAEVPSLRPFLPPSARGQEASYSYDPLPPSKQDPTTTFYDEEYFSSLYGNSTTRRRGPAQTTTTTTEEPGPGLMGGMLAQFERILEMVRDNPEQTAETEQLRVAVLEELENMREQGGVPGAFPGEDDDDP